MTRVAPSIEYDSFCPCCGEKFRAEAVLWQGIHVCAVSRCAGCGREIIGDLPAGHALLAPYQLDLAARRLFGNETDRTWLGQPFLDSFRNPAADLVLELRVERLFPCREVVILNCVDYLYGHALLKLLGAERHLAEAPGLVVIVQECLRWMVPKGVAEVWTVNISLAKGRNFYPEFDRRVREECQRFEAIYLSPTWPHPSVSDISRFTGVARHDFTGDRFRITFIWREDRPWCNRRLPVRVGRRIPHLKSLLLWWQNLKVRRLFSRLRRVYPLATMTVAGLGTATRFPSWLEDRRVAQFTDEAERETCVVYAQSRLVIGVHGSSMLLPSAHAGMTLDLMPDDRWANFAQDLIYQETDLRLAAYRYRYLPLSVGISALERIAVRQIAGYDHFRRQMTE